MNIRQIIRDSEVSIEKNRNLLELMLLKRYFEEYLEIEDLKLKNYNYQQLAILRKVISFGINKENFFKYNFNDYHLSSEDLNKNFLKYFYDIKNNNIEKNILYFIEDYLIEYEDEEKNILENNLNKNIEMISIIYFSKEIKKEFIEIILDLLKIDYENKINNPNIDINKLSIEEVIYKKRLRYKLKQKNILKNIIFFKKYFKNNNLDIFDKETLVFDKVEKDFLFKSFTDKEFSYFIDFIFFEMLNKENDLVEMFNYDFHNNTSKYLMERKEVFNILNIIYSYINKFEIDMKYTQYKISENIFENENKNEENKKNKIKKRQKEITYIKQNDIDD